MGKIASEMPDAKKSEKALHWCWIIFALGITAGIIVLLTSNSGAVRGIKSVGGRR
jgi:hypothetical protein